MTPAVDLDITKPSPWMTWLNEVRQEAAEAVAADVGPVGDDWKALPWQVLALDDTHPVLLLTGSAGGGKSRCWQEIVNRYSRHDGAFILVARKTRESMTAGSMLALAAVAGAAAVPAGSVLRYDNGSMVSFVGMKDSTQRTRIRSVGKTGDVDLIVMEEGNEFVESDYNELAARLRGKAGPYRQMIVATNPDAPMHWIHTRLIQGGEASAHYSSAADNTHNPPDYHARLEGLSGTEYQRLVKGRWVSAEGIVHDNWDPAVNLVDRFELAPGWKRIGAIDFGWEHPATAQWWAIDGDGRMILYREIYRTHLHTEDLAEMVTGYNAEDRKAGARPAVFYVDHAAGVRLKGVTCRAADKAVEPGLRLVNQRLRKAGDGKPRMVLFRDARVHPEDVRQKAARRPTRTAEEFAGYVWDVRQDGWSKDQPMKMHDDGMDAARYAAMAAEQPMRTPAFRFDSRVRV